MGERVPIRPCAVLIDKDKVLCIGCKYDDGEYFLFPGGGIEVGETLAETVIREMLEETGIKVKVKKLIYLDDWIKDKKNNLRALNVFFLVEKIGGSLIQGEKDGGKIKLLKWISLKDLDKVDFRPKYIAERIFVDYKSNFEGTPYFS